MNVAVATKLMSSRVTRTQFPASGRILGGISVIALVDEMVKPVRTACSQQYIIPTPIAIRAPIKWTTGTAEYCATNNKISLNPLHCLWVAYIAVTAANTLLKSCETIQQLN